LGKSPQQFHWLHKSVAAWSPAGNPKGIKKNLGRPGKKKWRERHHSLTPKLLAVLAEIS